MPPQPADEWFTTEQVGGVTVVRFTPKCSRCLEDETIKQIADRLFSLQAEEGRRRQAFRVVDQVVQAGAALPSEAVELTAEEHLTSTLGSGFRPKVHPGPPSNCRGGHAQ